MLSLINKLQLRNVPIESILLDPNNPRFIGKRFAGRAKTTNIIPENRIAEAPVQQATLEKMLDEEFEVKSIRNSISQNGFLPLDKIVVRPISENKYVVVEGNRRIAAIKTLLKQIESGEVTIEEKEKESLETLSVLVLNSAPDQIVTDQWYLQGIRHLSGIKDWGPYQKASLIEQMSINGKTVREIADSLGMTVVMVNRFYRTYQLIKQMEQYEDYASYAGPDLFTHFEEAYRIPKIRDYLGWNETESKFLNEERLLEFYSWIIPSDKLGGDKKLSRGKDVDYLAQIIDVPEALEKMRDPSCDLNEVLIKLGSEEDIEWKEKIDKALSALDKLTVEIIERLTEDELLSIGRLSTEIRRRYKQALALKQVVDEE